MAQLAKITKTAISIVAETELLGYSYSGTPPIEVYSRIDLGDNSNPIAGKGVYSARIYINNVLIVPTSDIVVGSLLQCIFISKTILLYPGDVISIRIVGQAGDVSVDTICSLRDATPAKASDIYGPGARIVDHNYGGANALAYTLSGVGITGACVYAFLASDYTAGNHSDAYIQARTTTTAGGAWLLPMMLNPGSYTLVFFKTGIAGPNVVNLTVT